MFCVQSLFVLAAARPPRRRADPFKLLVEGDVLYGRGTTDCLGHVALFTDMFVQVGTVLQALFVALQQLFSLLAA